MKRINVNIRPSDGYWYQDASGVKFKGTSWAQVVKKLFDFRKANNKPTGNPINDVMQQACSRNPQLCNEAAPPANTSTVKTTKGRVLAWLSQFAQLSKRQQLGFVPRHERNARVKTCASCPQHTFLPNQCAACIATIGAHTSTILDKAHEPNKSVSACKVLGIYLPVATWLDEATIPNGELPDRCWRKRR